jgi:tetratricopeptide (TPR) repeat protein
MSYQKAAEFYRSGLEARGNGNIEATLTDYGEAEAILMRQPDNPSCNSLRICVLFHRGLVHWQTNNEDQALADLDRAVSLVQQYNPAANPTWRHIETWYFRGCIRLSMGNISGAIEDFEYVLYLGPMGFPTTGLELPDGLFEQDFDRAIECVDQLLSTGQARHLAYFCRGLVWQKQGLWTDAIQDFERALQSDPTNAPLSKRVEEQKRRIEIMKLESVKNSKRVSYYQPEKMQAGVAYASYSFDYDGGFGVLVHYYGLNMPVKSQHKEFTSSDEAIAYLNALEKEWASEGWQEVERETGRGYYTHYYQRVLKE